MLQYLGLGHSPDCPDAPGSRHQTRAPHTSPGRPWLVSDGGGYTKLKR